MGRYSPKMSEHLEQLCQHYASKGDIVVPVAANQKDDFVAYMQPEPGKIAHLRVGIVDDFDLQVSNFDTGIEVRTLGLGPDFWERPDAVQKAVAMIAEYIKRTE